MESCECLSAVHVIEPLVRELVEELRRRRALSSCRLRRLLGADCRGSGGSWRLTAADRTHQQEKCDAIK